MHSIAFLKRLSNLGVITIALGVLVIGLIVAVLVSLYDMIQGKK